MRKIQRLIIQDGKGLCRGVFNMTPKVTLAELKTTLPPSTDYKVDKMGVALATVYQKPK